MAVGEGRRNRFDKGQISLSYPGKVDVSAILDTPPGMYCECLVNHGVRNENRLYFDDNLNVLAALRTDESLIGRVRLIYIDPPYATQASFESRNQTHAYNDVQTGPEYLEAVRQRIILMYELLAQDGSIFVHIDERMSSYIRVILDEVFGSSNFRNEIVRQKCNPKNSTTRTFGNITDRILFYSKTAQYLWNRPFTDWDEARAAKEYSYIDKESGRRYKKVPIHAPGTRKGPSGEPWRGKSPPPGKHWQFAPSTLDEMDARGEIYWSPTGNPRRKIYLDSSRGVAVQDLWLDAKDAHNQNILITGYPTEKNPAVLERIILATTNPGDLVLDAYAGSGTTLDVASTLQRAWIGIDNSPEALRTIVQRLTHGTEKMGDFVSSVFPRHDVLVDAGSDQSPRKPSRVLGPVSYRIYSTSDRMSWIEACLASIDYDPRNDRGRHDEELHDRSAKNSA